MVAACVLVQGRVGHRLLMEMAGRVAPQGLELHEMLRVPGRVGMSLEPRAGAFPLPAVPTLERGPVVSLVAVGVIPGLQAGRILRGS